MAEERVLCKVCKLGKIVLRIEYYSEPIPRSFWDVIFRRKSKFSKFTKTNIHCNTCGVKYEFMPVENLDEPKPLQIRPGLYVARESTSIFSKNR